MTPRDQDADEGNIEMNRRAGTPTASGRLLRVFAPLLAIVVAVALAIGSGNMPRLALDSDLCPTDEATIGRRVTLVVDLGKALAPEHQPLPGDTLDQLAGDLDKGDELRVFAVSEHVMAPRLALGRLCKPYAREELLTRETKARASATQCRALPAQLPRDLRDAATAFCERRTRLRERVDDLAQRQPTTDRNVPLVEALEETAAEFANQPRRQLYIFSDMFQHAHQDAQADARQGDSDSSIARAHPPSVRAPAQPMATAQPATVVEIFYLPRPGSTESAAARHRHQALWTEYFVQHWGVRPVFHDQPI